ncbi:DNA (cytosine-5)-methyltransferase 1 [Azospirillaceae bacterium]
MFTFYEFFAGGGMARAGLDTGWRCLFANDIDHKKTDSYAINWGDDVLKVADIRTLTSKDIPGIAHLAWASFPCQDLSLAGGGAGLRGGRSGTFWPFWDIMRALISENRGPDMIVLENVCGTLTSHQGKDFAAICSTFERAGYRFGALVVDAAFFVPQSRPRVFMIGARADLSLPADLLETKTDLGTPEEWRPRPLCTAFERLSPKLKDNWVWWRLPLPHASLSDLRFADIVEEKPTDVSWHTPFETQRLLEMMNPTHMEKVARAKKLGHPIVGAIYKRTRLDANGVKIQRAEIRFDEKAGCLRTPAGGSSRQLILVVDGDQVRSRLISSRETARLMGLPDSYVLPNKYNEAYHLTGDGVVLPVVRHLAKHIFEPFLSVNKKIQMAAA